MATITTIGDNVLPSLSLKSDASVSQIGRTLTQIYEFLSAVAIDALHERELTIGDQRTVLLMNAAAAVGQASQVLSGSSPLAMPGRPQ